MNRDNFMKTLINNDIYTSILVGEDKQSIEMNIKSQQSSTIILSETCLQGESAKKFVETQSSTYKILLQSQTYYMYEFKEAVHSQDNIILFEDNNKQIEVNDYKFMLAKSLWYDSQPYMAGVFGLKLQGKNEEMSLPEGTDFIKQLKQKELINSYVFVLDYKDDDNGVLYIGDYFHENIKEYSEENFMVTQAGYKKFKVKNWEINIDIIFSGNQIFKNETYLILYYELGIIAAPQTYEYYINNTFFKQYLADGVCKDKLNLETVASFKKYNYIECDKDKINKNTFPRLKFYNRDMNFNFSLGYEDLFYEHENKVYFLVIFPIYGTDVQYWYMGKPFIKKYKLFLDKDRKIIGLYKNFQNNVDDDDEPNKEEDKSYSKYIITIIVLAVVLIVSIISILYYFLVIKKSRRQRANELDEHIDYETKAEEEKDKLDKLIIN